MNKLSKERIAEKNAHARDISSAFTALEEAIDAYKEPEDEAKTPRPTKAAIEALLLTYNEALEAANGWASDVHDDLQAYFDDRSEKWQEGEKGEAFGSWIEAFEFELETVELDFDDLECPEDETENVDNLPESPDDA